MTSARYSSTKHRFRRGRGRISNQAKKQLYYLARKPSPGYYRAFGKGGRQVVLSDSPVLRNPLQKVLFRRERSIPPRPMRPGQSICSARSRTDDGDSPPILPFSCRLDRQQSCTTPVKTKNPGRYLHCRGCFSDTEPLERIMNSIVKG